MSAQAASEAQGERLGSGAMFDAIAPRYDLLNRIISFGIDRGWRRRCVRALGDAPARILDLATGTGDLAIESAKTYPDARVVGVDPSTKMLEIGVQKIAAHQLSERVQLQEGSAEELPFEDASFDAVTIAFGIRNVPDRPRALREMRRVTRPGGKVAVLELSEPPGGVMGSLARIHVHHVVPFLGGMLSGNKEYRYLQRSIAAFPRPEVFATMMEAAGLANVHAQPLTMGVAHLYVGEVPVR